MAKINKYIYGYNISSNYGQGWEVDCFEETYKEARAQLKCYRENSPYPVRMSQAREPNPAYVAPETPASYKVVRFAQGKPNRTIFAGLTLAEAQDHCGDPATKGTDWFYGFTKE